MLSAVLMPAHDLPAEALLHGVCTLAWTPTLPHGMLHDSTHQAGCNDELQATSALSFRLVKCQACLLR